jgi:hypothetical protein
MNGPAETQFLITLNTWEGAVKFLVSTEAKKAQPIELARFSAGPLRSLSGDRDRRGLLAQSNRTCLKP